MRAPFQGAFNGPERGEGKLAWREWNERNPNVRSGVKVVPGVLGGARSWR
jgi:hypothetical protein